MTKQVAIKVDVDTYQGLKQGVPALLDIFETFQIKASFFIAMGPDNSGRAIRRIFTKKGFLKKMLRTKAAKTYGLKTMLYGTLLPSPPIAISFPRTLQNIVFSGHELGIHGFDHVRWHDNLDKMSKEQIYKKELYPALKTYEEITGKKSQSSAAPGWKVTKEGLALQDESDMVYHSDCRGTSPFFPKIDSTVFKHLQIPTTLPTLDEILGEEDVVPYIVNGIVNSSLPLQVFTIHAEVEGMNYSHLFKDILSGLKQYNVEYVRLLDIAHTLLSKRETIPVCSLINQEIKGRAGAVAVQLTN